MKRPSSSIKEDIPKSKIFKSMPKLPADGGNAPAVWYGGGVIYTCQSKKCFRAIHARGDPAAKSSERKMPWHGDASTESAWKQAIKSIDDYHKK